MMEHQTVLLEIGEVRSIPRHTHDDLELFFLLSGIVLFELDGQDYTMRENDTIVCNPGQVRAAQGNDHNLMFRMTIKRDYLLQQTEVNDFYLLCNSCSRHAYRNKPEYEQVARLLRRMLIAYYQSEQHDSLTQKSDLLQLLAFLHKHFPAPPVSMENADCDQRIYAITQQIKRRCREELSLQEFADAEHLSLHYLSRLFKKEIGKSFSQYLNEVRLTNCVHDLLHSKESIIKIALSNGFPNVSSFNSSFLRTYGETPAKYRTRRSVAGRRPPAGAELESAFEENRDLAKFLKQFESKYYIGPEERLHYAIDAREERITPLHRPGIIVRVGTISQLLKADLQTQLKTLIAEIPISFVHARCIFDDGMYSYHAKEPYAYFEYYQIFDFLKSQGLSPYLQLVVSEVPATELSARMQSFFTMICDYFSRGYLAKWRFEVVLLPDLSGDTAAVLYKAISETIHRYLPGADVSISFSSEHIEIPAVIDMQEYWSRWCGEPAPKHVSFYLEPIQRRHFSDDADYQQLRHLLSTQVIELFGKGGKADEPCPMVDLQQWNTLSGFTTTESNTFYRCALFVDELMHLPVYVTHVSVWLNTYIQESATGASQFDNVSLFLFDTLKRPVYFALQLMDLLYRDIIYRQGDILCTRSENGDLSLLILNPRYFDPQKASDQAFVKGQRRVYDLRISGIEGTKIIEQYHIDNQTSSMYDHWANMGFPPLINRNVVKHLRRSVRMDYSIYHERLSDSYALSVVLDYNEATVILIRSQNQ